MTAVWRGGGKPLIGVGFPTACLRGLPDMLGFKKNLCAAPLMHSYEDASAPQGEASCPA